MTISHSGMRPEAPRFREPSPRTMELRRIFTLERWHAMRSVHSLPIVLS